MNAPAALDFVLGLGAAQASLQRKLDDALGTWHGLSLQDFVLLHALGSAPGERLTTAELEPMLGAQASAVVRQALALGKIGWIAREADASGGRSITLRTPGHRVLKEATETLGAICASAQEDCDHQSLAIARTLLRALQGNAALDLL